jgi:hypothetical protein
VGAVSTRHLSQFNFIERSGAYEELDSDERADYDVAEKDPVAAAENWARRNVE